MIVHLPHDRIDKQWWDAALLRSARPLWYGTTAVLDAAAPGWEALVDMDTGLLLPLPWRRKWGLRYVYTPFLLQQLGPFAASGAQVDPIAVLQQLPRSFRYCDLGLSPAQISGSAAGIRLQERRDLVLPLQEPVGTLRAAYAANHRRNLRKAGKAGLEVDDALPRQELEAFLIGSRQFKEWRVDKWQERTMRILLRLAEERGNALFRGVRKDGVLVAAGAFVHWQGRLIFLKGLAVDAGRDLGAMHLLIDHVIAGSAGTASVLDFAGSEQAGLARFYSGFGAREERYLRALVNRLPPLVRLLKP